MAYSFENYLQEVTFYDGTTTYTVPIWNLRLKVVPYHSSGSLAVEYFHGKNVSRVQGFRTVAEFDMAFGNDGVADQVWSDLLDDISNNVEWTIDFDPDTPGIRTGSFVLDDSPACLQAMFNGHIRNRPTKTKWISPDISASVPWWVSCTEDPSVWPDVADLILLLPESLEYDAGTGDMVEWVNLADPIGTDGDLDSLVGGYASGFPSACGEDAALGSVVGFGAVDEMIATTSASILPTIDGVNDDSEFWFVVKFPIGVSGVFAHFNTFSNGSAAYWQTSAGSFSFTFNAVSYIITPNAFNDGNWHVFRTVAELSKNSVWAQVDGYTMASGLGSGPSGALGGVDVDHFCIGDPYSAGIAPVGGEMAVVKVTEGILNLGRAREIYAYLRDVKGVSGIPADGTVTQFGYGVPGLGDLKSLSLVTGATEWTLDNQTGTTGLTWCLRKDDALEYMYYLEHSVSVARVKRCGYGGDNITYISTTSPASKAGKGLAIDIAGMMAYTTNGTTGQTMNSHSLDEADAADAWVEIIGSGAGYSMYGAIEYNPVDGYIYFIDSAAATPQLRKILPNGTSESVVATLTGSAGAQFNIITKDPDNNVLYFTDSNNISDICKYDLDTDTFTNAWHVPTGGVPWGLDIQMGLLWYVEQTTDLIYEIDLTVGPGSRTLRCSPTSSGVYGMIGIVFDTTA